MLEIKRKCLGLTVDNFTWSLPVIDNISDEQLNRLMPSIIDIFEAVINKYDGQPDSTMELILEGIQQELMEQLNLKTGEPELVISVINYGIIEPEDVADVEDIAVEDE